MTVAHEQAAAQCLLAVVMMWVYYKYSAQL